MTWRWLRGAGICTQHSQRARTAATTARHVPTIGNGCERKRGGRGVERWSSLEESRASVLKKSGSKEPVHKAASCCIIMTRDMTRSDDQILPKLGAWPLLFCPNITANRLRPLSCAVPNGTPFRQRFERRLHPPPPPSSHSSPHTHRLTLLPRS